MQAQRKPFRSNPKKSKVYEKSLSFAKELHVISEKFDDDIIRKRLRSSAVAIVENIAQSRVTMYYSNEFNYLNIAMKCINECRSLFQMAHVRGYLPSENFHQADADAIELLKMSFSLIKRLKQYPTNIIVDKWQVEDFHRFHLYNRSIDLMQSIYWLVDSVGFEINDEQVEKAYRLAIDTPLRIASGIGQLNMKIRNKKFSEVNQNLKSLKVMLDQFQVLSHEHKDDLNNIEVCRVQVLKLLNYYFGRLKSSNRVEQGN
ncbi:four helix bundle protein [Bacillus sp. ISL-55]|uniref:four helix bundle protein n=1 Tax=Bacillus sp. ISL-55 TaxID=2819134 RepID=UPI001BE7A6BA|nr:four helix bundle protein [Bacillus sp. ISL-55]MBT2694622.1 four helix bundle protein [Bacillus sp. ISL-55]